MNNQHYPNDDLDLASLLDMPPPSQPSSSGAHQRGKEQLRQQPNKSKSQQAVYQNRQPSSKKWLSYPRLPRLSGSEAIDVIAQIGLWGISLTIGCVIWAINGGFSNAGLEAIALSFNTTGEIFWLLLSNITFSVPVPDFVSPEIKAAATQPLIPWIAIISGSLLQISISYKITSGETIPRYILIMGSIYSLYDFGTTIVGISQLPWFANLWDNNILLIGRFLILIILSLFITFSVEGIFGFLLQDLQKHRR